MFEPLSDPTFVAQHRTWASAFSRTRKLGFRFLVLFLLNQLKGALQREIDDFFVRALGREVLASVTAAAVCIARRALRHTVFVALNQRLMATVLPGLAGQRWHGWRVLAIDGSVLNLPAKARLFEAFGGQCHNGRQLPMARLSQLWDVGTCLTHL